MAKGKPPPFQKKMSGAPPKGAKPNPFAKGAKPNPFAKAKAPPFGKM